ncbi:hypothetical protein OIO90_004083 [Microbotryomycetes sp. JL221]|nr:hypothetical protein OIO90_004083 [Microbotryomycetes sp. JL221]
MHFKPRSASFVALTATLLVTPTVLASPDGTTEDKPGFFGRIADAWDDLINGPSNDKLTGEIYATTNDEEQCLIDVTFSVSTATNPDTSVLSVIQAVQQSQASAASKLVSSQISVASEAASSQAKVNSKAATSQSIVVSKAIESSATVASKAITSEAAVASKAATAGQRERLRRSSTGAVPESQFSESNDEDVDVEIETESKTKIDAEDEHDNEEDKRSLLDTISDKFDSVNPFNDNEGDKDTPPVQEYMIGDMVVQDSTPTDDLQHSDKNAILYSGTYSILSTPSATVDILKILPTSLSSDELSSIASAIASMQSSANAAAKSQSTATTTSKSSMTPPASRSNLSSSKGKKVTIVVDAAMLETVFYGTPTLTTATVQANAQMTPGPVSSKTDVKIPLMQGGLPEQPHVGQPVAIELDTEDDDVVSFLGPVAPPPLPIPALTPDQLSAAAAAAAAADAQQQQQQVAAVQNDSVYNAPVFDATIAKRHLERKAHGMQMRVKRRHVEETFHLKRAKARE